jgi:signal transduction histidine kinase
VTDLSGDLRWILNELPIAIWVGNVPDGSAAYVNSAFERVMLMPPVPSSHIDDVPQTYGVFGRDQKPFPTDKLPFTRALAERAPVIVDDIVLRRPAGDIDIRAFGSPVFRADGSISHVIVAFFDVTAEMSAQRARQLAQERLGFVCNHAPIALWATDTEGTVTLSEGAGLASLGVKPGQLVGQNLFALYEGHPTIPGYVRRALAGESLWYAAQDGEAIFESWLAPLRDESGKMIGLAGFSNDVTELRKLQTTVIHNDRVNAMGTLAASVAHEINNPLTYMLARGEEVKSEIDVLERLVANLAGDEQPALRASLARLREAFAPVRSGTEQIATITRDLRTFSRADDSTLAPVSLGAVIDSVLKLVRKEVEARATLKLELQDTPPVMGNEARLVQVVLNLVVNALQALPLDTDSRKEVSLRTYVEDAHVVVDVADTGRGIPVEDRERVFDPFYTTKDIGKGTGLGLFVCRNIVRGLGGEVSVVDAPGGGALFRVKLPAGARMQSLKPVRGASRASTVSRHIVVIDDDALVLRALTSVLTDAGFRVTALGDGEAGLAFLLAADDVDLAYCDLMMKGMTGMELAEALSEQDPGKARKLVFMTGGAFSPKAQAFIARHSDCAVDKPFDIVRETRQRLT